MPVRHLGPYSAVCFTTLDRPPSFSFGCLPIDSSPPLAECLFAFHLLDALSTLRPPAACCLPAKLSACIAPLRPGNVLLFVFFFFFFLAPAPADQVVKESLGCLNSPPPFCPGCGDFQLATVSCRSFFDVGLACLPLSRVEPIASISRCMFRAQLFATH